MSLSLPRSQSAERSLQGPSPFSNLAIELRKHGYNVFESVGVLCADCGYFRIAVPPGLNAMFWPCPNCRQQRRCFVIGRGIAREVPAVHRACPPVDWSLIDGLLADEVPPAQIEERQRKCIECSRLFVADHANMKICGDLCSSIRASRRAAQRYRDRVAAVAVVAP